MELRFVTGEPALLLTGRAHGSSEAQRTLVISDLHIGIEHRYRKDGISVPSQSGRLLERIEKLIRKTRASRLVILGDIKHKVPGTSFQEERDVPVFFRRLLDQGIEVEITPGNHDDRIGRLLPEGVRVHPSTGFALGGVWLCHGHAWPPSELLDAENVVTGHNHVSIELVDKLGYRWKDPVWIKAELIRKKLMDRYKGIPPRKRLPELVLIPPFNSLAGLIPLNRPARTTKTKGYLREGPNPLFRISRKSRARVYLLDGTFLGELGKL